MSEPQQPFGLQPPRRPGGPPPPQKRQVPDEDPPPWVNLSEGVQGRIDSDQIPGPKRAKRRSGPLGLIRELAVIVVGALIVSALLRAFVGQPFIIPSQSMEKTLLVGDRIVVEKLSSVERGDVIVFQDPGGWLSPGEAGDKRGAVGRFFEVLGVLPDTSHGHLTKRLIGMPGDHVVCCNSDNKITINGYALDETYLPPGTEPSVQRFDVVVPAGRVFVLGDNRAFSGDSRVHFQDPPSKAGDVTGMNAFPPLDMVTGRAIWIVLPVGRATTLKVPETFKGVPPPSDPAPAQPKITQSTPG